MWSVRTRKQKIKHKGGGRTSWEGGVTFNGLEKQRTTTQQKQGCVAAPIKSLGAFLSGSYFKN